MNNSRSPLAYFFIFLAFLMSMRCWLGFEGRFTVYNYIFPFLMLFCAQTQIIRFEFKRRYILFAFLIYIGKMYMNVNAKGLLDVYGLASNFFPTLSILLMLCVSDSQKEEAFSYFVKWFGLIMIVGIPIYLLTLVSDIPSFGIIKTHYGGDIYGGDCYNYLFYLKSVTHSQTGIDRYNGPFIEPGDLGCVASFLLFAAQFEFKKYKYLWAVLAGVIFSFSLAGVVLTGIGYLTTLFLHKKLSGAKLTLIIVSVLIVYCFGIYYKGGDNVINNAIIARLQLSDETGISGNNRTTLIKKEYFQDMLNNTDVNVLLFGYDKNTIAFLNEAGLGAGYVTQIISTGLIGILCLILPYLYMAFKSNYRKYSLIFFAIFILYMIQRTDAYWASLLLCYVYGIVINEQKQHLYE